MSRQNRDLLVLTKKNTMTPTELEHEVELIIELLYHVENAKALCIPNEIIDLNRYKIITKAHLIQKLIRDKEMKPFVFICNKN